MTAPELVYRRAPAVGYYHVFKKTPQDLVKVAEVYKKTTTYNLRRYYVSTVWKIWLTGAQAPEAQTYALLRDVKAALPTLLEGSTT